jgi:predicted component of type VI protein secretion system
MNAELASRISQMEEKLADALMAHDKTREEALLLRQDCTELKDELQNLHSVRVSASSAANQCVQAVAELVERGIAEEASDHTLGRLRTIESSLHSITEALELATASSVRVL